MLDPGEDGNDIAVIEAYLTGPVFLLPPEPTEHVPARHTNAIEIASAEYREAGARNLLARFPPRVSPDVPEGCVERTVERRKCRDE